jgi:hypothetical protein
VKAEETLLGHCIARAYVERVGPEAAADNATSRWKTTHAMVRATPKATRVASFIVLWADALHRAEGDSIGIEEFVDAGYASRSTVYRRQAEFRELWPEHETPNGLARLLLDALDARSGAKLSPQLLIAV